MTRLDLANWLFDSQNGVGGLTARVFVNRVWAQFFGAGLSRTLEDFGGQGEMPTHPELLDALAIDFVESGWNVKHLVKRIVMSRAYRQSSLVPASLQERDPENRLLARQGRWRLTAEAVRDNALAVSGLLVSGRETSHPYQPRGTTSTLISPSESTSGQRREAVGTFGLCPLATAVCASHAEGLRCAHSGRMHCSASPLKYTDGCARTAE